MLKPPTPNVAGVTDTLDFVKNLWGTMNVPGVNIPGMAAPSLSTDELDKKIADLKAIEAWLNLNANMLRATIQTMEVQRGTIATLKAMGESMAQAMGQQGSEAKGGGSPFQFFTPPAAPPPAPQQQQQQQPTQPAAGGKDGGTAQAGEPQGGAMPAAIAWWNLLQEQFKQAAASAMSPEAMANAAALAQDAAARFMPSASETGKAQDAKPKEADEPAPGAAKARPKPKNEKS
jgi:hypothetical protein